MNRKKVVYHLLPLMQIGGVETAIFKSFEELNKTVDYHVFTVFGKNSFDIKTKSIWSFLFNIVLRKPDLVITSLWICHPFGWLCKLLNIRWVPFFHNSAFTHLRDKLVLSITINFTDIFFADSQSTSDFINKCENKIVYVIPYIFNENTNCDFLNKDIDLIWIGRNNSQKRLDLLLKFLKEIVKEFGKLNVKILISGLEYKPLNTIVNLSEKINVEILYNSSNKEVLDYLNRSKIYLLFSDYEGMSMSTIEAIQSMCYPVVRPVGEIPNYLNNNSAIFIENIESFQPYIYQIKEILENDLRRLELCNFNKSVIGREFDYVESFLIAVKNIQ